LHLTILIVSSFEGKDSRRDSIMSNQDSSSHDDYSTIESKFEKFDALEGNNRSRNDDEDNSSNTIRASTLH